MKDMALSKGRTIREHRKLWNWIADETLKQRRRVMKEEYFEVHKEEYPIIPHEECWCCEYSREDDCSDCPIDWGKDKDKFIGCTHSLYRDWVTCCTNEYIKASQIARQIAELPER